VKARARAAFLAVALLTLLIDREAVAAPPPAPATLVAGLAGEWTGALGYRDYQSDKLFELPVRTVIENVADGVTQVRKSVYDEGPRQAPVWIVSLVQWRKDSSIATATMRAGREPEIERESVEVTSFSGPQQWVIVYRQAGMDDDKPADIRVTETRNGDELISVKEVRAADNAAASWRFRNQTKLKKLR